MCCICESAMLCSPLTSALLCFALALDCIGSTHMVQAHGYLSIYLSIYLSGLINDPTSMHLILEDIDFAVDRPIVGLCLLKNRLYNKYKTVEEQKASMPLAYYKFIVLCLCTFCNTTL